MKSLFWIAVFFTMLVFDGRAEKIKFKAISKKELNVSKCDFYPEVKAMILDKRGEIDFEWITDGLVYRYSEAVRIKVLDDQVKEVGNVKIMLHSPENNLKGPREKVTFLNGCTYTLENGEIVKPCGQANVLYVQPFLYGLSSEPLFKRDTRSAVIDFPCGIQQTIATTISIPEGYEVEELPQAGTYLLTSKGAMFSFNALLSVDKVTVSITFIMKKLVYAPGEYSELKDFFEQLAELSKTVIVLKKKQV